MSTINIQKYHLLKQLNQAIESVRLHHFQHLGEVTNLKMYDAHSYWASTDDVPEEWFYQWCEDNYEHGYLLELGIHEVEAISTTRSGSHFYFRPLDNEIEHLYDLRQYEDMSLEMRRITIFEEFLNYYANFQLNYSEDIVDGKLQSLTEVDLYMEEYKVSLEAALDDLGLKPLLDNGMDLQFKEFCDHQLTGLNQMYQYVRRFKDNQVESFKAFVDYEKEQQMDEF